MASEDLGRDLISVNNFIKKHAVCQSICCFSFCLSVCLFVYLSLCLSLFSVCLSVCLSPCQTISFNSMKTQKYSFYLSFISPLHVPSSHHTQLHLHIMYAQPTYIYYSYHFTYQYTLPYHCPHIHSFTYSLFTHTTYSCWRMTFRLSRAGLMT